MSENIKSLKEDCASSGEEKEGAKVSLFDFKIMDVEKCAEYAHEMHQFMRQKAYETQTQFDKTLVYFCGGAIALSYGLFTSNLSGWSVAFLFSAIACWGVCCIMALLALRFQGAIVSGVCSGYYGLYSMLGVLSRMVSEIFDLEGDIKEELSTINKTPDGTPEISSENRLTVKQGDALHKKHEYQKVQLKQSIDTANKLLFDINTQASKTPTGNGAKLLIFVLGVCFFFAFTYVTHICRTSLDSQTYSSSVSECSVGEGDAGSHAVECTIQAK